MWENTETESVLLILPSSYIHTSNIFFCSFSWWLCFQISVCIGFDVNFFLSILFFLLHFSCYAHFMYRNCRAHVTSMCVSVFVRDDSKLLLSSPKPSYRWMIMGFFLIFRFLTEKSMNNLLNADCVFVYALFKYDVDFNITYNFVSLIYSFDCVCFCFSFWKKKTTK